MEWTPYSPGMNPIEHLQLLTKEAVCKINRDIEKFDDNDKNVREALFEALFKAWGGVDEYYLHYLVCSIQNRVKALIAAEGWYTNY